jgi:hypothetical protein
MVNKAAGLKLQAPSFLNHKDTKGTKVHEDYFGQSDFSGRAVD